MAAALLPGMHGETRPAVAASLLALSGALRLGRGDGQRRASLPRHGAAAAALGRGLAANQRRRRWHAGLWLRSRRRRRIWARAAVRNGRWRYILFCLPLYLRKAALLPAVHDISGRQALVVTTHGRRGRRAWLVVARGNNVRVTAGKKKKKKKKTFLLCWHGSMA